MYGFRGLYETPEPASVVYMRPRSGFRGLYETAEAASAVSIRQWKPYISNNYLNFLGEFEAIFETALAHESGP
jgi:hypothetical protein